MPRNVKIFEWLMYAVIALGVALAVFDSARMAALTGMGAGMMLIFSLVGLAVFGLFVWLAARRRKNWARWTLLVIAVIGFFMAYPQLSRAFAADRLIGSLHIAQYLMEVVALAFVFSGNARDWFRRRPAVTETAA